MVGWVGGRRTKRTVGYQFFGRDDGRVCVLCQAYEKYRLLKPWQSLLEWMYERGVVGPEAGLGEGGGAQVYRVSRGQALAPGAVKLLHTWSLRPATLAWLGITVGGACWLL